MKHRCSTAVGMAVIIYWVMGTAAAHQPPSVDAGEDVTLVLPDRATRLWGTASADGRGEPIVLTSPTGSGKSTQVPRWCRGQRVLVVEPRRVACKTLAARVGEGAPLLHFRGAYGRLAAEG